MVVQSSLVIRDRSFEWGKRTYIMGVLNVTPDSFSDGGEFDRPSAALEQAQRLVAAGADIIDIGGQSTRPGAIEVSVAEELERVLSVVQLLRPAISVPISVDTTRAAVARAAIASGADIVNDISGGVFDPEMLATVAKLGVPIVLMHMRGTPQTMQQLTDYEDLIGEIYQFLESRVANAIASGIDPARIIIDPGIGFAKKYHQSIEILRRLSEFRALNCPILVGASRKSFIGHILEQPDPKARVWGTAAACCGAIANGTDIVRVHDVKEMHDVCRVADALFRSEV
ncbi:MAG: Dihydropteroate synthase [Chroococcidiopsis cubana SAG 39.79]|jgi:dihydropteroate synthase|uniref:Dihydropteroate synthase n=1 Tax=Chroococcidiopsis cubana SAG 39.79 TaxID=388085 RepID=A0AB37UCW5_9CYAN|nr:dihydropteroate synthase [Chroococcidiopsis cubana]MDZ4872007.1 Dihydropteroate synthase [Chroococcidiopsis cubana SAG 39.79]PSB49044.1 dihydropteroate synthase [Cyanosarcina cf. burmensis CCALA 770]PSB62974.1 dihydropteroate synthase [Chroococcidiopsis cubana CCALA 043]RUT06333.1 dihydropteroate synthase [Chroococcidiopsis cubana SAG 39.79]